MPRVGEPRSPARPTTDRQYERQRRILRAAARLGSQKPLDHVQMQEVAQQADVSLGTLYRYYPSKYHLFAQLLVSQVAIMDAGAAREAGRPAPPADPPGAVGDLVAGAVHAMMSRPLLARAMITSTNVVRAESGAQGDVVFRDLILSTAGITDPTDDDRALARLVEQCAYGVLTWTVAGELSTEQAEADLRRACRLLLSAWA